MNGTRGFAVPSPFSLTYVGSQVIKYQREMHRAREERMGQDRSQRARAFWTVGPAKGEIRPASLLASLPAGPPGSLLVRTLYTGVSRGTETLVFQGRVPASQSELMRCPFQEGAFPYPVKYGYALVGIVEEGPDGLAGQTVFCLHPHQDRLVIAADAVVPVPHSVPPGRAVLAANMETALNGVWDAELGPGDRVCVIGAGVIGLLVTWLAAQIPGVTVTVIDTDPQKQPTAEALGGRFVEEISDETGFDAVIHASGNPAGLITALTIAGFEATITELSWFGTAAAVLPLGEAFHSQRLTLRASQVGQVSPRRRPRWSHRRRLQTALALLTDPRLDLLIDGESAFAALPGVMRSLADGSLPALCHRIRF